MTIPLDMLVSDIAARWPATIPHFERLRIEYCCGGRIPLAEACASRSLDADAVRTALVEAAREPGDSADTWTDAPLGALVDHILTAYHEPLRRDLDLLDALSSRVASRHGADRPEVLRVRQLLERLRAELDQHLVSEEAVLFPTVRLIERGARSDEVDLVEMLPLLMREHQATGDVLDDLARTTSGFVAPEGACPTYRALYSGLARLERELHRHIFLENHILFPRAAELERRLV
jgi:regulator of cell morphogenesis and NO signaling